MGCTFDKDAAARRTDAYVSMLKEAYGVDSHGLADMLGVDRGTFTKFERAPWGKKSTGVLFRLASVTGVSVSWLFAEGEGVA